MEELLEWTAPQVVHDATSGSAVQAIRDIRKQQGEWATAYLALGANLGDPEASILAVLKELASLPTIEVVSVSSLYETVPVGVTDQPNFLNAVAEVCTSLTPNGLLETILALEKNRGRVRTLRWGPRVIDIDILTYDGVQCETPALTLPHPRLEERAFALVPLTEIAPDLVLPGRMKPIRIKAQQLKKDGNILSVRSVRVPK